MPIYKCQKCDKEFIYKNDYRRHTNRINSCKPKSDARDNLQCDKCNKTYYSIYTLKRHMENSCVDKPDTNVTEDSIKDDNIPSHTYMCKYCKNTFSRSDSLNRHIAKYCRIKNQIEVDKETIYKELIVEINELKQQNSKIDEMKREISVLKESTSVNRDMNSNNINSNNVINNGKIENNNYDIKVIAFGQEDLYSIIDDNDVKKYLKRRYQAVYQLIDDMHFNPDRPELHNVFISNMSHPYALKFNGEEWVIVVKDEVVDQMFDDKACYLNSMFKELKKNLDKTTIRKYSRFMNEPDKDVIDGLKRDIKLLLYNKRHIPIKTKKLMS